MTRARVSLATIVAVVLTLATGVTAHPAGTTTVTIAASATGAVEIAIEADADALIAKLEALETTAAARADATPEDRAVRLTARQGALLERVDLRFGGEPARLEWRSVKLAEDGRATIRLGGPRPTTTAAMTWRASFIYGSYALVVKSQSSSADIVEWLEGSRPSTPITLRQQARSLSTVTRALGVGFTHILPSGLDHILFVLGLYFLSTRARQVLAQVTAFTVAHSITLGLTLYGVIALPSRIVEPLIALSVAYVGIENLVTTNLKPWRIAVVFAFGLLHGIGFAEALANLHLARSQFLTTLISFNAGVEAGQLTVIAIAAITMTIAVRTHDGWRRPATRLASAGIGLVGLVWTIERLI